MPESSAAVCFLFTDIEGSTRLWERHPERMRDVLARHDGHARAAVAAHGGRLVKHTGDGIHAAFADTASALRAALAMQQALSQVEVDDGLALPLRCGLHWAQAQARDGDFFGAEVNRAARVMSVAHGGQILLSQAAADALDGQLPEGAWLADQGRVRLRGIDRPEQLWQLSAPPLRTEFPALRDQEATPNNLVQPLNRFIGREQVLDELRATLAQQRLLTLLGTGGIGKSRLSLQLAGEVLDDFADGAWFVELAPLADGQRVAQAMATVLGVREQPGRPVTEALRRFVADRQLLLVLDNCEHVLDAAAALAKLVLQAGPRVKVVATSREVLRVAGELVYPVPTLSVPEADGPGSAERLLSHDAVRLFADRAASAQRAFVLDDASAGAVVEICRRVDGIPLAIELAAARVRALPVQAIAARLRDNYQLLATRDATVAPRQRTLKLLIDWSHDLLTRPEQVLYRRLSVFSGGFTLEAAEAVTSGPDLQADEVLDLLTALVDKSLVALAAEGAAGDARYRMLETVREHASQHLAQAEGSAFGTRLAHAHECLRLAAQARPALGGPQQALWLARLDADGENLLAALNWCAQAHGPDPDAEREVAEVGLRLSFTLGPYWHSRGLVSVGVDAAQAVLRHPAGQRRDLTRGRAVLGVGQLCNFMGRHAEALQHLEECAEIAQSAADRDFLATVLQQQGMLALGLGDPVAARRHFEAAVAAARAIDNPRKLASACNALAQLERMEDRLDAAEALYAESAALARHIGDQEYIASMLLNQAMVALRRGKAERVCDMLLEVMRIADSVGSHPVTLSALDVCAGLAASRGDWRRAASCFGQAEARYRQSGLKRDAADDAFLAPMIRAARERLGDGPFAECEQDGGSAPTEPYWTEVRRWLEASGAG